MTKYTLDQFNYNLRTNSWERVPRDPMTVGLMITQGVGYTTAAALASVGTFGIGTYLIGLAATTLVTGFLLSALAPKPKMPSNSRELQANIKDAAAPHEIVYGKVRKGGVITHMESTDDNQYLHIFLVLAGHEIEAVEGLYINDEEQTDNWTRSTGIITGTTNTDKNWKGKIRCFAHLGDQTAASSTFESSTKTLANTYHTEAEASAVTSTFIGKGLAYLYIRLDYDADVFSDGIPNFTAVVKGKKVQNTSGVAQTYPASANAALVIRDYLISEYGVDDDSTNIDATNFATAQTVCDTNSGSGNSNKFEVNGVLSTADDRLTNLEKLTACCGGALYWGSGKWKLKAASFTNSVHTLKMSDLRGEISIDTKHAIRDQFNEVNGTFIDADQDWVTADYPAIKSSTYLTEDNNEKSSLDLAFPMVTNSVQAQRLAKLVLNRHREQLTFTARFGLGAFKLQIGDTVKFNDYNPETDSYRYGFYSATESDQKTFEIVSWDLDTSQENDLQVVLTFRETSSTAYDWDADEATITSNNTNLTNYYSGLGITASTITATDVVDVATDGTISTETEVSWTAATNNLVTQYDVEFKRTSQSVYKRISTSETSINLGPLAVGQAYDIRVRSRTSANTVGSFASISSAHVVTGDTTAPDAPTATNPATKVGGYRTATIGWNAPSASDLKGFKVYRATTNTQPATEIAKTSDTRYTDGGLADNTTYYYWVEAFDHSGNDSTALSIGSVTTQAQLTDGEDGVDGVSGLTLILSNESHVLAANNSGTIISYAGSGTTIKLFEGPTAINYDGVGTSNGTFKVTTSASGITAGSISDSGSYATVGNASSMTAANASVTYTITGKRADGTAISLTKVQSFSRADAGSTGATGVRSAGRWSIKVDATDAGSFVTGTEYVITHLGDGSGETETDFTLVGASENKIGVFFTATGAGTNDGTATALPTTSARANTLFTDTSGNGIGSPVDKDQAIFFAGDVADQIAQKVWIYDTGQDPDVWVEQFEFIDGNLLVAGTITSDKIDVTNLSALSANLGDVNIDNTLTLTAGGAGFLGGRTDSSQYADEGFYIARTDLGNNAQGFEVSHTSTYGSPEKFSGIIHTEGKQMNVLNPKILLGGSSSGGSSNITTSQNIGAVDQLSITVQGGGGGGGFGKDDGGSSGRTSTSAGGDTRVKVRANSSTGTVLADITATGGLAGRNAFFGRGSAEGNGDSTTFGSGGTGGANQSVGGNAPSTSYGAGGGGGGGDSPSLFDSSGNMGEGGDAGETVSQVVDCSSASTVYLEIISIGSGGTGSTAGDYNGGNGAPGIVSYTSPLGGTTEANLEDIDKGSLVKGFTIGRSGSASLSNGGTATIPAPPTGSNQTTWMIQVYRQDTENSAGGRIYTSPITGGLSVSGGLLGTQDFFPTDGIANSNNYISVSAQGGYRTGWVYANGAITLMGNHENRSLTFYWRELLK